MNRVAIIGCSHSDDCGHPDGGDYIWVRQLADAYPNIQFHNYSKTGHGALYYDMVLKHIISRNLHYSRVIIQWTGSTRWMSPVSANNAYNEKTGKTPDFVETSWWHNNKEHPNLKRYRLTWPRIDLNTPLDLNPGDRFYGGTLGNKQDYISQEYDPSPGSLSDSYTRLMIDSLDIYKKYFNIFNFGVFHNALPRPYREKIPVFQTDIGNDKLFVNWLDDTLHLTPAGNRHLWSWLQKQGLTF